MKILESFGSDRRRCWNKRNLTLKPRYPIKKYITSGFTYTADISWKNNQKGSLLGLKKVLGVLKLIQTMKFSRKKISLKMYFQRRLNLCSLLRDIDELRILSSRFQKFGWNSLPNRFPTLANEKSSLKKNLHSPLSSENSRGATMCREAFNVLVEYTSNSLQFGMSCWGNSIPDDNFAERESNGLVSWKL